MTHIHPETEDEPGRWRRIGRWLLGRQRDGSDFDGESDTRRAKVVITAWAIVVTASIVVAFVTVQLTADSSRNRDQAAALEAARKATCTEAWANASAARSDRILKLSTARNAALSAWVASTTALYAGVIKHAAPDVLAAQLEAVKRAGDLFQTADDTYNNALKTNPLPPAPRLSCGDSKPSPEPKTSSLPAPVPTTVTRSMTATATSTSTTTETVTHQLPGGVRTVPGSPRTVTKTRTVTKQPPSCLTVLIPPCVLGGP